jgi:hypothetical protein
LSLLRVVDVYVGPAGRLPFTVIVVIPAAMVHPTWSAVVVVVAAVWIDAAIIVRCAEFYIESAWTRVEVDLSHGGNCGDHEEPSRRSKTKHQFLHVNLLPSFALLITTRTVHVPFRVNTGDEPLHSHRIDGTRRFIEPI